MPKVHNYSAGPCILPQEVFEEASKAVLNYNKSGLSILEMSHRSKDFVAVMEEARDLVKEILEVPDGYTVLFLQGGASLGFLVSAYNMIGKNKKGGYINTGAWAKKAIKEADFMGESVLLASSEDKNNNKAIEGSKTGNTTKGTKRDLRFTPERKPLSDNPEQNNSVHSTEEQAHSNATRTDSQQKEGSKKTEASNDSNRNAKKESRKFTFRPIGKKPNISK